MGSRFARTLRWVFLFALGWLPTSSALAQASFSRGDTNASGGLDITDGIRVFGFLFLGSPAELECRDAADANDDGILNLTDGIHVLQFLFSDGAAPGEPFPDCGEDLTEDALTCIAFDACPQGPSEPLPAPELTALPRVTRDREVAVSGTTAPNTEVEVVVGDQMLRGTSDANGSFSIPVTLVENRLNRLFVTAITVDGVRSAPSAAVVTHDEEPPKLFVDFPALGSRLTSESVTVVGRVSDMLSGFRGLLVTVNGESANVDIGIGTNGTFERANVPLPLGENTLAVTATDGLGNETTKTVTVTRVALSGRQLVVVTGNNQEGRVQSSLGEPLVVRLEEEDGTPVADAPVTFRVKRSDGVIGPHEEESSRRLEVTTNASGVAQVFYKLGTDAGCGNNRVEVSAADAQSPVFFCATATPAPESQINIGSGNNQRGEVGSPAVEPLRAWVSDGCNGTDEILVTFTVTRGDGTVNGEDSVTVPTSVTGHASVNFVLGSTPGNNVVEATFAGNRFGPANFVVFGVERSESLPTSFSGIVFDNSSQPIEGATCSLAIPGHDALQVVSSRNGQFRFVDVPVSGPGHLHVNGLTATHLGDDEGGAIPPGSFPSLSYEVCLVPNAENSLSTPVLLPPLEPDNATTYDGTKTVELTVKGVEGLRMVVRRGTRVTLPDGTVVDGRNGNATALALNQVHHDKVPMPMPDGAAPPFAWTLQPGGATFDPPLQVIYPNMSSLRPGAATFFLSFDHDTEQFAIVATGQVAEDGECIVSDPGSGIAKAGWGCNCPPYSVTGSCTSQCQSPPMPLVAQQLGPGSCVVQNNTIFRPDSGLESCECGFVQFSDINYAVGCNCSPGGVVATFAILAEVADMGYRSSITHPDDQELIRQHELRHIAVLQDFLNEICPDVQSVNGTTYPDAGSCQQAIADLERYLNTRFLELDARQDAVDTPSEMLVCRQLLVEYEGIGQFECPDIPTDIFFSFASPQSWQVSVGNGGLSTRYLSNFTVSNVSSPDLFGVDGPGTSPDFLSDDFLRIRAVRAERGLTEYAFSEVFQIRQGETYSVGNLTFTDSPPLTNHSLDLTAIPSVLTAVGENAQLATTALLSDGTTKDVTPRTEWTVYRTSNPNVVRVGRDGLAEATGVGRAVVTAVNEGATAVTQVLVVSGAEGTTTIDGVVQLSDGTPVAGATVSVAGQPVSTSTSLDGSFELVGVAAFVDRELAVVARLELDGRVLTGTVTGIEATPGGLSHAGVVTLEPFRDEVDLSGFTPEGENEQGFAEYTHNASGIRFVLLPGGTFPMGSGGVACITNDDEEVPSNGNERNARGEPHEVTVAELLVAKYEVCQAEWLGVFGFNPATFRPGGEGEEAIASNAPELLQDGAWLQLPVEGVSWNNAQHFCRLLDLDLPTEAQWEYACRGGTTTPWHFGDTIAADEANFDSSNARDCVTGPADATLSRTAPVSSFEPNPFGLFNVHGNVAEWTQDSFNGSFYSQPEATLANPVNVRGSTKVNRGGHWANRGTATRSSFRRPDSTSVRNQFIGFRPTKWANIDSDGDGLLDRREVPAGLDPHRTDSNGNGTPDGEEDTDGDGLTNLEEAVLRTSLNSPDSDGDGLRDGDELAFGANPLDHDTDNDGFGDNEEAAEGSDPADADSLPPSLNVGVAVGQTFTVRNNSDPSRTNRIAVGQNFTVENLATPPGDGGAGGEE